MSKIIEKLISISSDPLTQGQAMLAPELLQLAGNLGNDLELLLNKMNGFFVFESALRVFPSESSERSIGLVDWNSKDLWRQEYLGLADGCLFFAEDIFGGQFCIKDDVVCSFDPETGDIAEIASSIEGWVDEILKDYQVLTGYPLAHEWQSENGILPNNMRLMPKIPFVCGGQFQLANLMAIDAVSGMRTRANLARQIVDMPDGAQIEFKIIE